MLLYGQNCLLYPLGDAIGFMCGAQVLKSLGVLKADNKIARSHIIIGKGGKIQDVRIGISPGDSVSEAVQFVESQ